jgi:hypothetical protein
LRYAQDAHRYGVNNNGDTGMTADQSLTDEKFRDWWNVRIEEAARDGDEDRVEKLMNEYNEAFVARFPY